MQGASILNETGDGFLIKFSAASDAVETALRLQCLLREEICEGEPMVLRIGLHMGEVSEMEEQITGDTRAVGMAINLCARIMDLAGDGQILLTRGVFDEARQYTREHPSLKDRDAGSLPRTSLTESVRRADDPEERTVALQAKLPFRLKRNTSQTVRLGKLVGAAT